jgi:hypothetical protein
MTHRRSLVLVVCLSVLIAAPAFADSITFSFDCDITGAGCSSTSPVGTLQITDDIVDPNLVDLTLTLASGGPQQFYMNYDGFPLPGGFTFSANGTTIDVEQDAAQAGSYSLGLFDLVVPKTGNISGNPFTTTLMLTNGATEANLDAQDFGVRTTDNTLYAALLKTRGGSWFGASTCDGCTRDVPEPASLTLLGMGAAGALAALRRRRRGVQAGK